MLTSEGKSILRATIILVGLGTFSLIVPLFIDQYYLSLLIMSLLYAYLALSWNLIGGFGGQFSLGHSIFFGVGAYVPALLALRLEITPWLGIWVGAILSFIIAGLIGVICFKFGLKGFYFAVATLAMSESIRGLAIGLNLGGPGGKIQIPLDFNVLAFVFRGNLPYYYIILILFVMGIVITYVIKRSRMGYYLHATRVNEAAAEAQGVNTFLWKVLTFGVSGALTSLGGTFYAQYVLYICPDMQFSLFVTVEMFLACFIGGKGTILGPILGSFLLSSLGIALRSVPLITADIATVSRIIYGVIIILVVVFLPNGLVSFIQRGGICSRFMKAVINRGSLSSSLKA